jgi:hypothetical protein
MVNPARFDNLDRAPGGILTVLITPPEKAMTIGSYPTGRTALLFVDPYNDILADGGKL